MQSSYMLYVFKHCEKNLIIPLAFKILYNLGKSYVAHQISKFSLFLFQTWTIQAITVRSANTSRNVVRQENVNVFEFTYTSMATNDLNINFNVDLFVVAEEWEFVEEFVQHQSTDQKQDSPSDQDFPTNNENIEWI